MKIKILFIIIILMITPSLYSETEKPVAVVLAGGGARGAYQIGVWKAMLDCEIDIGAVYGVSVGAINGAMMAVGDFKTAKDLWQKIEKDNVMNIDGAADRILAGEFSFRNLLDAATGFYNNGGIDVSPLEALLRRHIDEDTVRSSGIDFGLAAFSVTDIEQKLYDIEDIPQGQLVDYILASANFPLFQRKFINGEEFIDGGIYKNMIINMVDSSKFNKAIVVALDFYAPEDILDLLSGYSKYDFELQIITPGIELGSILDFNPEKARKLMRIGYLDGLKASGKLSGTKYYIYGKDTIKNMYLQLEKNERRTAAELLEISIPPAYNFTYGYYSFDRLIVPELREKYDTDLSLLEHYAQSEGLPADLLYSEAELLHKIINSYIHRPYSSIYYDRYLDFLSYLDLKTEMANYSNEEFSSRFLESYKGFTEE